MTNFNSSNQEKWREYFQRMIAKPHRPRTEQAVKINESGLKIAVECGCGTGADTAYLANMGYTVHAFDINKDAMKICAERFSSFDNVKLDTVSFEQYDYPQHCGIVIANASFYFANANFATHTWVKITNSIQSGGIFIGDFLGDKDDWADDFEQPTLPLTKSQVLQLFEGFKLLKLIERDEQGTTALGTTKHWHTFSVIAKKL